MTDRATKFRRLERFRRSVPHTSASALAAVLAEAKLGLPELSRRQDLREARDFQLKSQTNYGPILRTLDMEGVDGSRVDLTIADPFALLYTAAHQCEGFSKLLWRRLRHHPCTHDHPWHVVIYSDEVVPGNQMSFHNQRKSWVLYWSFKEFGMAVLSSEDAWFCIAAERSDSVKMCGGGIAQVFGAVLKHMFASGGHTLQHSGILLDMCGGGSVRLFAELDMILQDGGAHKHVQMVKGDAGHKFCTVCRTLYARDSGVVDEEANENILTCTLVLESEMDFANDDDVRGTVRRLAHFAATEDPKSLKLRETACGFNHSRFNMLLDPALDDVLKPVSHFAHDWMHAAVVNGFWNTVLYMLLISLIAANVRDAPAQLGCYVAMWTLPSRIGTSTTNLADAFSSGRWKSSSKAKHFKCTASDAISMYGIIACYVQSVWLRAGICVLECEAYMAAANVLDLFVALPHGSVTSDDIRLAVDAFLRACLAAGWRNRMHPKFHWLIHLGREFWLYKVLLSCWVHERKHKVVKRYSNEIRNTCTYEASVISELTCLHLFELDASSVFDKTIGLLPPTAQCKPRMVTFLSNELGMSAQCTYLASRRARVSELEVCAVGDVVLVKTDASLLIAEVWVFASVNDEAVALVSHWPTHGSNILQGTATCRISDARALLVPADDVLTACAYRRKPDGFAQVLVPCIYRGHV